MSCQYIIHLSDLHFGFEKDNPTEYKAKDKEYTAQELNEKNKAEILQGIKRFKEEIIKTEGAISLVVISGDLLNYDSHDDQTIEEAGNWIKKLLTTCDINSNQILICPGNHDPTNADTGIDQANNKYGSLKDLSITELKALENSLTFYKKACKAAGIENYSGCENYSTGIRSINNLIAFSFNSAIQCGISLDGDYDHELENKKEFGQLEFGLSRVRDSLAARNENQALLSTYHHSHDFLNFEEQWNLDGTGSLGLILEKTHISFFGHDHPERPVENKHFRYLNHLAIQAGALHLHPDKYPYSNYFNVIKLSDKESSYEIDIWNVAAIWNRGDSRIEDLKYEFALESNSYCKLIKKYKTSNLLDAFKAEEGVLPNILYQEVTKDKRSIFLASFIDGIIEYNRQNPAILPAIVRLKNPELPAFTFSRLDITDRTCVLILDSRYFKNSGLKDAIHKPIFPITEVFDIFSTEMLEEKTFYVQGCDLNFSRFEDDYFRHKMEYLIEMTKNIQMAKAKLYLKYPKLKVKILMYYPLASELEEMNLKINLNTKVFRKLIKKLKSLFPNQAKIIAQIESKFIGNVKI